MKSLLFLYGMFFLIAVNAGAATVTYDFNDGLVPAGMTLSNARLSNYTTPGNYYITSQTSYADYAIEFDSTIFLQSLDYAPTGCSGCYNAYGDVIITAYDEQGTSVFNFSQYISGTSWYTLPINQTVKSITIDQQAYLAVSIDNIVGNPVPLPAAVWLFGPAILGVLGLSRRKPV